MGQYFTSEFKLYYDELGKRKNILFRDASEAFLSTEKVFKFLGIIDEKLLLNNWIKAGKEEFSTNVMTMLRQNVERVKTNLYDGVTVAAKHATALSLNLYDKVDRIRLLDHDLDVKLQELSTLNSEIDRMSSTLAGMSTTKKEKQEDGTFKNVRNGAYDDLQESIRSARIRVGQLNQEIANLKNELVELTSTSIALKNKIIALEAISSNMVIPLIGLEGKVIDTIANNISMLDSMIAERQKQLASGTLSVADFNRIVAELDTLNVRRLSLSEIKTMYLGADSNERNAMNEALVYVNHHLNSNPLAPIDTSRLYSINKSDYDIELEHLKSSLVSVKQEGDIGSENAILARIEEIEKKKLESENHSNYYSETLSVYKDGPTKIPDEGKLPVLTEEVLQNVEQNKSTVAALLGIDRPKSDTKVEAASVVAPTQSNDNYGIIIDKDATVTGSVSVTNHTFTNQQFPEIQNCNDTYSLAQQAMDLFEKYGVPKPETGIVLQPSIGLSNLQADPKYQAIIQRFQEINQQNGATLNTYQ